MSDFDDKTVRLGRGLAALIGERSPMAETVHSSSNPARLMISDIAPNPLNPRSMFDQASLDELTMSIKARGVIQPLVVRPAPPESSAIYEIVAGERRWRASQQAGLTEVPAVIVDLDDDQALEVAIIENVQRDDLNPIEEGRSYETLLKRDNYTQDDVARIVGKSRSHIANLIRLLNLPVSIQRHLELGDMSVGQARPLIGLENAESLAQDIIAQKMNARAVERAVKQQTSQKDRNSETTTEQIDADAQARRLSEKLGLSVRIAHDKKGQGRIMIDYINLSQLDMITAKLDA